MEFTFNITWLTICKNYWKALQLSHRGQHWSVKRAVLKNYSIFSSEINSNMFQPLNESTSLSYQDDRSLTFQTFFWFLRNLTFVTDIDYLAGRESFYNFYQAFVQTFWPTWSPQTVRPGGLETPIAPISRYYAYDTTIHLWPSFVMHQKDRRGNISTFRYLPGAL